jgi:CO/xanthine dehydrogenase Mo-binding subunit
MKFGRAHPARRTEDDAMVRGQDRLVPNVVPAGVLRAVLVRSPRATVQIGDLDGICRMPANQRVIADYLETRCAIGEWSAAEERYTLTACTTNVLGLRGAGEAGAVDARPAVKHAVLDALRANGFRHLHTLVVPEGIWRALCEGKDASSAKEARPPR